MVSIVITIFNIIIKIVVRILITWIGYSTLTADISAFMIAVFISTFFSTGILLLLSDANLSQITLLSWIPGIQKGPFPDLTEEWYLVIAPSLIFTMFLNAIAPLIEVGTYVATAILQRALDQGFSDYICCKATGKTTKCTNVQQYVNLYGGPAHQMAPKYAALMNTVCVTFMYGVALPELWLIAALTFFLYYVFDKFLITYYYKRPPMYDDKLNKWSLELMEIAPLFLCFFGYWCMGNMQIFNTRISPIINISVPYEVDHNMWPGGNQALPLFILGVAILIGWLFGEDFLKLLKACKAHHEETEIVVNEDLGTFFECCSPGDRKAWLAQEVHNNKVLNIFTMGSWTREQLLQSKSHPNKTFLGCCNYEIICNPDYQEKFQFTPI